MRFVFCVVVLTLGAAVKARPGGEGEYGLEGNGRYFENNLDSLQGALEDISKAGEDLEIIETTTANENSLIYLGIKIFRTSKISTFLSDIQSCLDLIRLLFQSLDDQS